MSISRSDSGAGVAAQYFDGRSARAHAVVLTLCEGVLRVEGGEVSRSAPLAALRLSEPMGRAARLISFADGAHLEVRDHAAFAGLLAASGHRDAAVVRWAFQPPMVGAMLAALVLSLWLMWQYGLPWASRIAAPHVPDAALSAMSDQTLAWLDHSLTRPSTLAPERQQSLRDALQSAAMTDGLPVRHTLLFRAGGPLGANAFALPDGTLIVTDELVALADGDDGVLAVLMHELGHVHRRHGVRLLLQGSATALVMVWYLGDVSSLLAAAPTALLQASYSRAMEREADDFAASMLSAYGQSPGLLADMLDRLARAHGRAAAAPGGAMDWLSSHPDTAERIARLRAGDTAIH
jgi:Zn-dependent protease with chaperone function